MSDTLFDLLKNEAIISGHVATETEYAAADDLQPDASQAEPEQTVVASQEPVAIANEEATEQLSLESAAIASDYHASESATAEEEPLAHTQIDLHDALLSDELYEDWAAEEAELAATPIADSGPAEIEDSLEIEELIEANTPVAAQEQPLPFDQVVEVPNPITRLRKPSSDVLVSTEQPVIVSHVEGPRSILVGREASYRVTLENTSRTPAQNLSAAIHVPDWTDLVDVTSTSGVIKQSEKGSGRLEWHLPELAAHSSQTLRLRLIPRIGREFQLGVQWSQESAESHARVEVLEPKLEMTIRGPQEVLFGLPQRYRLILSNPGTGPAEGVAVSLIPPGGDSASATTHTVGTLGPEEVKELELELTAREAGELIVQAIATAEGDLKSEVTKRILCRKPELEIDWRGPDRKYAGTETTYYFRVHNSGTATTEPVEVKVRLPEGIRFLSASDSYAVDAVTGVVTWRLPSLTPGEEQYVQFHCQLDRPGLKEFDVTARTINGDLSDTASVRTEVIALADLKLEVDDPRGACPIGEPVLYEIRVVNRGTTDARGIAIVGLFSEGIDPVSVEGAQNLVREGRVTFEPVKSLPAGGEILLRIHAVASRAGTHIFRAEVVCEDLDIRLAAEETTRFFEDEFHWDEGETPYTAENRNSTKVR
ncbi:MAG: DUF11 domain-containing protein [Planctomycetes bacterium]|nr:DUF11 domain-containing protein [Planctomycetota bacterium]